MSFCRGQMRFERGGGAPSESFWAEALNTDLSSVDSTVSTENWFAKIILGCGDVGVATIRDSRFRFGLMLRLRLGVSGTCETVFRLFWAGIWVLTGSAVLHEGESLILERGGVRVIRACLYVIFESLTKFWFGEIQFCVFVTVFIAEAISIHLRFTR